MNLTNIRGIALGLVATMGAQAFAFDFVYDGVFYDQTGEMSVKIVKNPTPEKYTGNLIIPQFFNIVTYSDEGEQIINSYFVNEIGEGAFEDCTELRTIELPQAVVTFGKNAFKGCTSLRGMTFPDSPFSDTNIGEGCFEGCTRLGEIELGAHIGTIGAGAFAGCTYLDYVTIKDPEPPVIAAGTFDDYTLTGKLFVPKSALAAYRAADVWSSFKSISYIAEYSFIEDGIYYLVDELNTKRAKVTCDNEGCYTGDIVVPDYVTHNGMTYTVTEIGRNAFRNSIGVTSITFGENVRQFGVNAFEGCAGLTEITIPEEMTSLPADVFRNCSGLKKVNFSNTISKLDQRVFQGCLSLEEIDLPADMYLIGAYAFEGCASLKNLSLPTGLQYLGINSFQNCTKLETLVIPESVYSVDKYTFAGCSSLRRVECLNTTPIRCDETAFSAETYAGAALVVPDGTEEAYRTSVHGEKADGWQKFKTIVGASGVESIAIDAEGPAEYYTIDGRKVAAGTDLPAGIYIKKTATKTIKIKL